MVEFILTFLSFTLGWWLINRNAVLVNWPFLGHFPQLAANLNQFHQWSTKVAERSEGSFLFKGPFLMKMDMMCTVDPLNIKHIMNTNFSNYPKGPDSKEMFQVLGDGIFNADLDTWRFQRKIGVSVINKNRFRELLLKTTSVKVENHLFQVVEHIFENGLEVDLQELIHKFTMDNIYKMIMGYDPEYLNNNFKQDEHFLGADYIEEPLFYRHVTPWFLWKFQWWLGFGEEKKMRIGSEILGQKVIEFIERKSAEESVDLLAKFLKEKDIQGPKFTNLYLKDIILNFALAG